MQAHPIQIHVHGSMSEGPASYLAHDHAAAEAGTVELIWWMDHDWRVANFAKVESYGFEEETEYLQIPNRDPSAQEPTSKVAMTWAPVPDETTAEGCTTAIDRQTVHSGRGSLRLAMPAGAPGLRTCTYIFDVRVMHERYPLVSRPRVRIAVRPNEGVGDDGSVFIRFKLSEQPPDLRNAELVYVLGGREVEERRDGMRATVPLPWKPEEWNVLEFDLAGDVERLGLPGGLDNSLHRMLIGLTSYGPRVQAHFDSLEMRPVHKGPEMLKLQRSLIESQPMRLQHLVGTEVSYYGPHINAFGSGVPVPDYQALLPTRLTTGEVVAHIHRHGGLASYNHPPVRDPKQTAAQLLEHRAYGADLIEVAHARRGMLQRLQLWDLLSQGGLILTGLAVSDAHQAAGAWESDGNGKQAYWVSHVWSASLTEDDLLEALRHGRLFLADPAHFRGTIDLHGPQGIRMGDVVAPGGRAVDLTARIEGLHPGDLVSWVVNGHLMHAGTATGEVYEETRPLAAPDEGVRAVRLQVHRPALVDMPYGGIVALSNPVYLTETPEAPARRVRKLAVESR